MYPNLNCCNRRNGLAAELMPVATATTKGLMSAADKKYGVRYLSVNKNSVFKIAEAKYEYEIINVAIFASSGVYPCCILINGRCENDELNINVKALHYVTGTIKLYQKGLSLYVYNVNPHDQLEGFYFSSWGFEEVGNIIDDTYTEISIK